MAHSEILGAGVASSPSILGKKAGASFETEGEGAAVGSVVSLASDGAGKFSDGVGDKIETAGKGISLAKGGNASLSLGEDVAISEEASSVSLASGAVAASDALGTGEANSSAYTGNKIEAMDFHTCFKDTAGSFVFVEELFSVAGGVGCSEIFSETTGREGVGKISSDTEGGALSKAAGEIISIEGSGEEVSACCGETEFSGNKIFADASGVFVGILSIGALVGNCAGDTVRRIPSTNVRRAFLKESSGRPNPLQLILPDSEIFAEFASLKSKMDPSGPTSGKLSAFS